MIVPIVDEHLILIREYAVEPNPMSWVSRKGLIDPGETVFEAANRSSKKRSGLARITDLLKKLSICPSLFFQQNEYRGGGRSSIRSR